MEKIITFAILAAILFFASVLIRKFKSRTPKHQAVKTLHFKTNELAFEYADEFFSPIFMANQMSLGIVRAVEHSQRPDKIFTIELAGNGGKHLVGGINKKYSKSISVGNLIYWGYVDQVDESAFSYSAVGHVIAILEPEFNPSNSKWTIKKDLTR